LLSFIANLIFLNYRWFDFRSRILIKLWSCMM